MGCKELIESLRVSGDGKVRAMREESEQEAERIRAEAARRIEEIRRRRDLERRREAEDLKESVLAEAAADARRVRIRSERALADRLAALARAALPSLRNEGYDDVFADFARDLPRLRWKTVRVNPRDEQLAITCFPDSAMETDEGIRGGMLVIADGERVQVVNTFEKRLERKWEELLPEIMRDVMEKVR